MNKKIGIAALAVAALLTSACSSGNVPDQAGDRTRLGDSQGAKDGKPGSSKKVLKKAAKVGEQAESQGKGGDTSEGTSAKAAGQPPSTTTDSEVNPAFARRTSVVDDPNDDSKKSGLTPQYAEITKASVVGLGEDFRMTLTLDGSIPQTMPDDKTHMIVAFGITGTRENEGYSFGAQCTQEGWAAYAGGKDDGNSGFPGTFFVDGNTIEMTVPWDYIDGPRAFEWYAASNWFSQIANQTNYRIDLAPSNGLAKFPQ